MEQSVKSGKKTEVKRLSAENQNKPKTCREKKSSKRKEASPWSAGERVSLQCFSESERSPCPNTSALGCREKTNRD